MSSPNILWFTTDRQRSDTLSCYGNRWVTTPCLDALAAEGALFEQAYAQSPICSPSRASFMTGRYPRTTRVNRNGQALPGTERLISRLLADAGYLCGHGGKMHLSPGSPTVTQWCESRVDDGYVVFDWSLHPPGPPVNAYTAWLAERGIEFQRTDVGGSPYAQFGMPAETSNPGWTAQRAINFIRCSAQTGRPWLFTCNVEAPHNPFDPPEQFLRPYLDRLDEIPLPRYVPGELDSKPVFQRTDHAGVWGSGSGNFAFEDMTDRDHKLIRAAYWALCDHIDFQVGRVIQVLRETGQRDNTLVLFTSDHSEMLGDHGVYFQGPYFYPEMIRVPLIMTWPGHVRPIRSPALVELVDLAPTLLSAAGVERYPGMQGRSLWPILTGQADPQTHREDVYAEYYQAIPGGHRTKGGAYVTGLRNNDYALSVVHNLDDGELYDLRKDPGETRNAWRDPNYDGVKMRLLKRLCDRMAETIDPLPPTLAPF